MSEKIPENIRFDEIERKLLPMNKKIKIKTKNMIYIYIATSITVILVVACNISTITTYASISTTSIYLLTLLNFIMISVLMIVIPLMKSSNQTQIIRE